VIRRFWLNCMFHLWLWAWAQSLKRDQRRHKRYRTELAEDLKRLRASLVGVELQAYRSNLDTLESLTRRQLFRRAKLTSTRLHDFSIVELAAVVNLIHRLAWQSRTKEIIEFPAVLEALASRGRPA
jgi:hypothetical protein